MSTSFLQVIFNLERKRVSCGKYVIIELKASNSAPSFWSKLLNCKSSKLDKASLCTQWKWMRQMVQLSFGNNLLGWQNCQAFRFTFLCNFPMFR